MILWYSNCNCNNLYVVTQFKHIIRVWHILRLRVGYTFPYFSRLYKYLTITLANSRVTLQNNINLLFTTLKLREKVRFT